MNLPPPKSQCRYAASLPIILPVELITEVLSFLPVKSLMRMKCCRKSWNVFMSDPFFVELHLQRSMRNPHLTFASKNTRPTEYSSVVPISLSRLLESPSKSIALTKDPYYHLKDKDCKSVIGSCNGLICLFGYSYNYGESWLRFWNPATRTISDKLGHCHNPVIPYRLAFGYDSSMDTYKVVALEPEARVFSFRDNVWKSIQRFPMYHRLNASVHLSGNVNWLATRRKYYRYDCTNIPVEQYVIISLDLSKETYKELLLPKGFDEVPCFDGLPLFFPCCQENPISYMENDGLWS